DGRAQRNRGGPTAVALTAGGGDQVVVLELDRHDRLPVGDVESELAGRAGRGAGGSGLEHGDAIESAPTGEHRGREAAGVAADDDEVVCVSHRGNLTGGPPPAPKPGEHRLATISPGRGRAATSTRRGPLRRRGSVGRPAM